MNLNLGLESLNSSNSSIIPFTPASAIEMQNASEAITNLMASLENFYDAARNAMLVKKAVKKYGKTQSIVALIGQEGLAAAQSFSMEGFWQKTKDFLWKIWSKIKEWWGRFWGMFFSVEDKLRNFKSSLEGKILLQNCEFEAPGTVEQIVRVSDGAHAAIKVLEEGSKNSNKDQVLDEMKKLVSVGYNSGKAGELVSMSGPSIRTYKYTNLGAIKSDAEKLISVFEKHRNSKKDIDRYTDAYLRNIKDMKITGRPTSATDVFGRDTGSTTSDDPTAAENDTMVQIIKTAAKVNNNRVSNLLKVATTVAVKLMANTRVKNK